MKKSKIVWALYIIAALLGIVFLIMLISSIAYLHNYAASYGVGIGELGGEAISYIFSNSISYLIYGIIIFACGRVLEVVEGLRNPAPEAEAGAVGFVPAEKAAGEAAAAVAAASVAAATSASAASEEKAEEAPARGPVPPLYTERSIFRY